MISNNSVCPEFKIGQKEEIGIIGIDRNLLLQALAELDLKFSDSTIQRINYLLLTKSNPSQQDMRKGLDRKVLDEIAFSVSILDGSFDRHAQKIIPPEPIMTFL